MEGWECKDKLCVSLCVGMGMVEKLRWGFLKKEEKKEK